MRKNLFLILAESPQLVSKMIQILGKNQRNSDKCCNLIRIAGHDVSAILLQKLRRCFTGIRLQKRSCKRNLIVSWRTYIPCKDPTLRIQQLMD